MRIHNHPEVGLLLVQWCLLHVRTTVPWFEFPRPDPHLHHRVVLGQCVWLQCFVWFHFRIMYRSPVPDTCTGLLLCCVQGRCNLASGAILPIGFLVQFSVVILVAFFIQFHQFAVQARSQGGCEGCARTTHKQLRSTFLLMRSSFLLKNGVRGAPITPPKVHFFLIAPPIKNPGYGPTVRCHDPDILVINRLL